jgi:tetratricopeptide (TPR) repeat protein
MISKKMYFVVVCFCVSFIVWSVNIACAEELNVQAKQDELYTKALTLKEDGDYDAAYEILKKLVDENPNVSKYELSYIDTVLDQSLIMKESGNSLWKVKTKEVGTRIKKIYSTHTRNAYYYLVYAKYSWIIEARREAHIYKALDKAFYFKPGYGNAYILKGDIYFDRAKNASTNEQIDVVMGTHAPSRDSLAKEARNSYESALSDSNLNNKRKAYVLYKIGELESQILGNKEAAKTSWEKAATLSPDSKAGKLARERLGR